MCLENLETTIRERKSMIVFPSHLKGKWDVYIKSEELDTTKSNKLGVDNKEMITNNHY